jgi:hypothetical protein
MSQELSTTIFVEYPPNNIDPNERGRALMTLFNQNLLEDDPSSPLLAEYLHGNGLSVALALNAIDTDTAQAIRVLNQHDVSVIAWVVLKPYQGYFLNKGSATEIDKTVTRILKWRDLEELTFAGIGFDIEKPLNYLAAINNMTVAPSRYGIYELYLADRAYRFAQREEMRVYGSPQTKMSQLVSRIRREGLWTEAYVMPRFARILGGDLELDVDKTVQMLYTSPLPVLPVLMPFVLRLLRDPRTIPALGIVTGIEGLTPGVDLTKGRPTKHLSQEALERDLRACMNQGLTLPDGTHTTLSETYLFAMNHARVAQRMLAAQRKVVGGRNVHQVDTLPDPGSHFTA